MTRCSGNVQPLSQKLLQKFYDHSSTGCSRKSAITQSLKPINDKFHNIWSVILNHSMIYNNIVKLSNGTKPQK